jgi:hypothetical protein
MATLRVLLDEDGKVILGQINTPGPRPRLDGVDVIKKSNDAKNGVLGRKDSPLTTGLPSSTGINTLLDAIATKKLKP